MIIKTSLKILIIVLMILVITVCGFFMFRCLFNMSGEKQWNISYHVRKVPGEPRQCAVQLKVTGDDIFCSFRDDYSIIAYVPNDDAYVIVPHSESIVLFHTEKNDVVPEKIHPSGGSKSGTYISIANSIMPPKYNALNITFTLLKDEAIDAKEDLLLVQIADSMEDIFITPPAHDDYDQDTLAFFHPFSIDPQ